MVDKGTWVGQHEIGSCRGASGRGLGEGEGGGDWVGGGGGGGMRLTVTVGGIYSGCEMVVVVAAVALVLAEVRPCRGKNPVIERVLLTGLFV